MFARLGRNPIAACIAATLGLAAPASLPAGTVLNCNDAGPGSLRAAIAAAVDGETIQFDTATMNCTKVTLSTGELHTELNALTLQGPPAGSGAFVAINANFASRVISHGNNGPPDRSRVLTIRDLHLGYGNYSLDSALVGARGGCVFGDGDVTLVRTALYGCVAGNESGAALGGAVYAYTLHMDHSSITYSSAYSGSAQDGLAGAQGGAAMAAAATIVASTIIFNNANMRDSTTALGGGLFVDSSYTAAPATTIDRSNISFNSTVPYGAPTGNRRGGGVYFRAGETGSLEITQTTISGNGAAGGAGLFAYGGPLSSVTVRNSTISTNFASGAGAGAVVHGGSNRFVNVTIAVNTANHETFDFGLPLGLATFAAGLSAQSPALFNTIVSNNAANDANAQGGGAAGSDLRVDGDGSPEASGGHNLVMHTLPGGGVPADTLTSDPLLDVLQNNGGSTATRALLAGSPAIDAGTRCVAGLQLTDQRGTGYPRVWGGKVDIGAYEYGEPAQGGVIFRDDFNPEICAP